jgi:hypothetical protein
MRLLMLFKCYSLLLLAISLTKCTPDIVGHRALFLSHFVLPKFPVHAAAAAVKVNF